MLQVEETAQKLKEGVMAVLCDADWTLFTMHTGGYMGRYPWEKPWEKNIRAFLRLKEFMNIIRPIAVVGCITYNENIRRINGSFRALGFENEEDYLKHLELIDENIFPFPGKNKHIAECLLQYYRREDAPTITRVLVLEDDEKNIKSLRQFHDFVSTEPYCREPRLKEVEIVFKHIVRPAGIVNIERREVGGKRKSFRTPIMTFDEALGLERTQEEFYTHEAFIQQLKEVEDECLEFARTHIIPATIHAPAEERINLKSSL